MIRLLPWRRAKVETIYFTTWISSRLREDTPYSHDISIQDARNMYNARQEYTAVVLRARAPYATIWSRDDLIFVTFFDALAREYPRYEFVGHKPGQMFLELATFVEFDGDAPNIAHEDVYLFRPSGEMIFRERNWKADTAAESAPRQVDVSGNWEPYPEFGEYAGLLRTDRPNG